MKKYVLLEHEKVCFVSERIKDFKIFWFLPNAQGPPKIFDVQFFQILRNKHKNGFLGPGKYGEEQSQKVWLT